MPGGGKRPARVLYVFVDLPVGGAEVQLLSLVRHLDRGRYDPIVLCIGKNGPIGEEISKEGVPVVELGLFRKGGIDRAIVKTIREFLRKGRISLLHSHLYHANLYGRLAAFREGVPAVCTIHNTYARPKAHRRFINWWLARRTARIIAVSKPVRDDIIQYDHVDPSRIVVIPNGVEWEKFDIPESRRQVRERIGLAVDRFAVGSIGRFEEQKGLRYLLEAIQIMKTEGKDVSLLLAGSGKEEVTLREQAARAGIEDSVLFLGTRRDVADLYRAMDVFALPSLWEGGPITLLEAMASRLPVVATPVGFVPEVLQDGVNGYLVPAKDPHALAGALWRVRENPDTAKALAIAAWQTVQERYSHRHLAGRVMDLYGKVLSGELPVAAH